MNILKLLLSLSTLGLTCMTTIAMQLDDNGDPINLTRQEEGLRRRMPQAVDEEGQEHQDAPSVNGPIAPEADGPQGQAEEPPAPAVGAQAAPIEQTHALQTLHDELTNASDSLRHLISNYNPIPFQRNRPTAERIIQTIHARLTDPQVSVRQLRQQFILDYINNARTQGSINIIRDICGRLAALDKITLTELFNIRVTHIDDAHLEELVNDRFAHMDAARLAELVNGRLAELDNARLAELGQYVHTHFTDYNPLANAQELQHVIDIINHSTTQLEGLPDYIHELFNDSVPLVNQHLTHLNTINRTIDTLRTHLRRYIRQGVDDDEQIPLENADRNLTREINAFFRFTQNQLNEAHRSISATLHKIRTLSHDTTAVQDKLKNIAYTGELIKATQKPPVAAAAPAAGTLSRISSRVAGVSKTLVGKFIAPRKVAQYVAETVIPNARLVGEPLLRTSLRPRDIPRELDNTHEALVHLITQLDETLKQFRAAAVTENAIMENIRMLCKILDSRENSHFNLEHQDEIEQSLATSIIKSNLRTQALRALLLFVPNVEAIITRLFPEETRLAYQQQGPDTDGHNAHQHQPIDPIQPQLSLLRRLIFGTRDNFIGARDRVRNLVKLWPGDPRQPTKFPGTRRFIEYVAPELPGILAGTDAHEDDIQPYGQQPTFDDRYTNALINTQNPNFLLYDIAARTRLNTGRFSYLIRPLIYRLEEMGGPRREDERPGTRYSKLMQALTDKSTPLEHPWLIFSIPPQAVRGIESILRVADHTVREPEAQTALPYTHAPRQLEGPHDDAAPMASTSLKNFIWQKIKHLTQEPARKIGNYLVKKLTSCGNCIKRCAHMITAPFIRRRPIIALQALIARKAHEYIHKGACSIRWMLCQINNGETVRNLERNIREGHPASEILETVQSIVTNNHLEGVTNPLIAVIAKRAPQIREFARQNETLERIDPIIPLDPHTNQPLYRQASIHDERLRTELGGLLQAWEQQ